MNEAKIDSNILNRFNQLVEDETEYSIVTTLQWYNSLNLKKISTMIGKPESTTLRYIRRLKKEGVIEFDSEKSEDSWGKYYKLSSDVKTIYESVQKEIEERASQIIDELQDYRNLPEEELNLYFAKELLSEKKWGMIPSMKNHMHFVSNLQKVIVNETIYAANELSKKIEKEGREKIIERIILPPFDLSYHVSIVKLNKLRHILMMNEIVFDFMKKIKEFNEALKKEMDAEKIPEEERKTQFINLFTGSLDLSFTFKD